jgi:RNA polymerase sigma-54 factor
MGMLSQRLQIKVSQSQYLTPSLLQMVKVLQLNVTELKELLNQEVVENPVLEESTDEDAELTAEELAPILEAERHMEPAEMGIIVDSNLIDGVSGEKSLNPELYREESEQAAAGDTGDAPEPPAAPDSFEETDLTFDEWLEPGFKTPASESIEKPSFETFLSSPVTLCDHLRSQLSISLVSGGLRDAAEFIIGNLDEDGYLSASLEEIAALGDHTREELEQALSIIQSLDPAGVGARDLRECLLLQIESRNGRDGVAWQIVTNHLKLLETRQLKELARVMGRPDEHIDIAVKLIRHLDARPGLRYNGLGARLIEPDVYVTKDGEDYIIQMNDEGLPQLRLSAQYRRMLDKDNSKEIRNYVKERYTSAIQLMKSIEQRKQTILKVCEAIVKRQTEFLSDGVDRLRPMMIKDVADEVGVHASTVSRAVSNKYMHTPQGVFELRYFFSEAVQGPTGGSMPLSVLKRKVKKMIEEEDRNHPQTDDQIALLLQQQGIQVTRRTVAKYREDLKIPPSHLRRNRE